MQIHRMIDRAVFVWAFLGVGVFLLGAPRLCVASQEVFVEKGRAVNVTGSATDEVRLDDGALVLPGGFNALFAGLAIGRGDFRIEARATLPKLTGGGASLLLEGNYHTPRSPAVGRYVVQVCLDGAGNAMYLQADETRMLASLKKKLGPTADFIRAGEPFELVAARQGERLTLTIDGKQILEVEARSDQELGSFGFAALESRFRLHDLRASGQFLRPQAAHTDVWVMGHDGYHTYRIPSLSVTTQGTVLAFAEARNPGKEHGDVDVVMKRSVDGGKTWSAQQVLWNPGDDVFFARDPSPVVDRVTGKVIVLVGSNAPYPGETEPGPRRLFKICSDDDGETWSAPAPLSLLDKQRDITMLTGGPARGVQLTREPHEGRLVVPGYYRRGKGHGSCLVYSDDHGTSWNLGGTTAPYSPESAVVELGDGSVMLNARGRGSRTVAVSRDGGETFAHVRQDKSLPDPLCHAALCRYHCPDDQAQGGKSRLLFCNPVPGRGGAFETRRRCMTVRMSHDDGRTWPVSRKLYPGFSAYSAMTILPDGRIAILYEKDGYRRLSLAVLTLDWVNN